MFGLVIVRYSNLPTNLLQDVGFFKSSLAMRPSLRLDSKGNVTGFEANKPESLRISKVYFLWQIEMPLELLAISKAEKNFKGQRSLSLNLVFS